MKRSVTKILEILRQDSTAMRALGKCGGTEIEYTTIKRLGSYYAEFDGYPAYKLCTDDIERIKIELAGIGASDAIITLERNAYT